MAMYGQEKTEMECLLNAIDALVSEMRRDAEYNDAASRGGCVESSSRADASGYWADRLSDIHREHR